MSYFQSSLDDPNTSLLHLEAPKYIFSDIYSRVLSSIRPYQALNQAFLCPWGSFAILAIFSSFPWQVQFPSDPSTQHL